MPTICFSRITLTQKRVVYGLWSGYLLTQLIVFEKYGSMDNKIAQQFVKVLNITLLVLVTSYFIISWFQPSRLEKTFYFINAISFSLQIGWLILCASRILALTGFYIVNVLIALCILSQDILKLINSNQVLQSERKCLRDSLDEATVQNNLRTSTIYKVIHANSAFKNKHKFHSVYGQTSNEILSTTDPISFEKVNDQLSLMEINLVDDGKSHERRKSDCSKKCKKSVNNLSSKESSIVCCNCQSCCHVMNASTDTSIFDGCRANMRLLPLVCVDSIEVIPRNLTWECFGNVEHRLDSSSCHIYTAVWIIAKIPVILKLIKTERLTSAVAVAEFETEENVLLRTKHPNIVRLLGSGNIPRKFLVLELLSGGSLAHSLGKICWSMIVT
jgi:hypothetical protein